jgi:outer membrane protein, heavy metal efflux system
MSRVWFFIVLYLSFPVPDAYPLTVEQAVSQALQKNPDLQVRRLEMEVAQGQLEKAKISLISNPVMESFLSGKDRPQDEGGGNYTNYGFKLSQEFEIAGQRGLRIDIAEKGLSRLALEIEDRERALIFDVKEAFARVLAAKRKEQLTRQVATLQEELLSFTGIKFKAGEVSGLEVNLAEVELGKSRKDLLSAGREYLEASLGLQELIGGQTDMTLAIMGELSSDVLPLPDKGHLIKPVMSQRPDMKAALIEVDKTKIARDLVQRSLIPNIVLGGFYNRDDLRNDLGISVSISIPLFDRKQAEKKEALARAAQARVKQAGLQRTIHREVEEAYNALVSAQQELSLFRKEILDKSLENFGLLNLAYKEGKIGFFNVRLAQKDTIETQFAYLDTLLRARRAVNALEKATGGDLK